MNTITPPSGNPQKWGLEKIDVHSIYPHLIKEKEVVPRRPLARETQFENSFKQINNNTQAPSANPTDEFNKSSRNVSSRIHGH